MQMNRNPMYNEEGYADPTAYAVIKGESELEKRANWLVKVLKSTIRLSGFELANRIELKDTESGRYFR